MEFLVFPTAISSRIFMMLVLSGILLLEISKVLVCQPPLTKNGDDYYHSLSAEVALQE